MKSKSLVKYLIYALFILCLIFLDGYIARQQAMYQKETFNSSVAYSVISMVIKMSIGLILGLEYIINENKKEGNWKINLPKLILLVIPFLYFSIAYFFYDSNQALTYPMFLFMKNSFGFVYISQLILGFFIITSFYKNKI